MKKETGYLHNHEALHTACMFHDMVQNWLVEHPAINTNKKRVKLATKAADALQELYQLIGSEHL